MKVNSSLNALDLMVLSIINGSYVYKGVLLKEIHPVSILDIQNITGESYDSVTDVIVKLMAHNLIYFDEHFAQILPDIKSV